MTTVLVVEDEVLTRQGLTRFLAGRGFQVLAAATGPEGLDAALAERPDVVILDVTLPGADGLEVCRELRERGFTAPVLFLTARDQELDKLTGFGVGADDYVTKPASLLELEARIRVALRRANPVVAAASTAPVLIGERTIDLEAHEVRVGDEVERLSSTEHALLACLLAHRGRIVSRELLLETVWGYAADATSRTVDTHVLNLRRKLRDSPTDGLIETVRGVGYRFRL